MGKSVRNTDTSNVADEVAQSLGMSPKSGQPPKNQPAPTKKQQASDLSDSVAQSLGLKKKDGGGDGSDTSSDTESPSPSLLDANKAFQNRTATDKDIDVLSATDQGKQMGLSLLSPEGKKLFAEAHNGPKKADAINDINGIIDTFYPASQDPRQNKVRDQIKSAVASGDQNAIKTLRDQVTNGMQQQINNRLKEVIGQRSSDPQEYNDQVQAAGKDSSVVQLREKQEKINQTLSEYGQLALATGKDMEPWLQLDSNHPHILTSEAADKLGKAVEDRYGITKTTPNKEYDRMRTGMELITRALQMDVNDLLTRGLPTKNKELLDQAQTKIQALGRYRDWYNRLDTEQFPDVGLDRTARYLGDIIAEQHPNKIIRTKEDVREAAQIADQRSPGFMQKYGHFVDAAAEKQGEGTFIPRGGGWLNELLGGLQTSSAGRAIELMKWKARVVGDQEAKDKLDATQESAAMRGTTQSKNQPTKIVYDNEGKAYREIPNENYGTMPWNNFFRFAGESIPGLLEFIGAEGVSKAIASGGVAAANAIGKDISLVTNTLIGSKDVTTGYEAIKFGKNAKDLTGLIGATYLTSYNSNREFADANIDDKTDMGEAKKIAAANFLTMANAGVFHLLGATPSKMVEAAISKAVMPDVIKLFEENDWEKLSKKTVSSFVNDQILPRAKAVMDKFAETGSSGVKLGAAAVTDQKLKDLVGAMTNDKYKPSTVEDNARVFVQQALLMTTIGLPAMIGSGLMPHSTREALHQAGLYAPQYIDIINDRVDKGELDMHKAAGMVSMIKTMGEELAKARTETNDDGTPLSTRQIRDIAIENFRKRGAEAMAENKQAVPSSAESEPDKQIKEIKKENNWQAIDETPVFKSIKSKDGEKVKQMDDIDPAKKYTYEKEPGESVTTSGAELIHHLETGDIYEKVEDDKAPGDKDKVADPEKGKDAKGEDNEPAKDQKEPVIKPKEIVDEAIKEGKIPENLAPHVQADPETFLRDVADQALGFMRQDGERVKSDLPDAEKGARHQFGDKVVDAALKMFPAEAEKESVSRETSAEPTDPAALEANRNAAAHLQASYDRLIAAGTDPADSEMVRLKDQIDKLSSTTTDNGKDVQKTESADGAEGGERGQGSGSADGQKDGQKEEKVTGEGGGDVPPPKPGDTKAGDSPIVGIRDSIVNEDRVHRGLQPLVKEFVRSWGQNWNRLKRSIANGFSPRSFIEDTAARLANGERVAFTDYDYATLLFDRLNTLNNLELAKDQLKEAAEKVGDEAQPNVSSLGQQTAAQDLINTYLRHLEQNDVVGREIKSETGRALSAIQMMVNMNGDMIRWSDEMNRYFNGNVPAQIKEFVERIEKQYKEANEQLKNRIEELLKQAGEAAFTEAKKTAGKPGPKKSITLKGKDLADKIRSLRPKGGSAQANLFGLPIAVYDTALLAIANAVEAGAKLIDAVNDALKDVAFPSDKDRLDFMAHLQNVETPESPQALRAGYIQDISSLSKEKNSTSLVSDMVKPLKKLMTSYVQDGSVGTLDELVKKTQEDLKDILPDADERQLRDAFSGYGEQSPTKTQTEEQLGKLRQQARDVSEYQDLLGKPASETPAQEGKRMQKANKAYEKVSKYMREAGVDQEPPAVTEAGKKAIALERAKKRMSSMIESLKEQILAGERKERNGVESDSDLDMLRAEHKRLSDQLNEIDQSKASPEEKIKRVEDTLNRQIANYERQIKTGLDPLRPREDRPTTKQIQELRKRKNELKKEVDGLRNDVDPNLTTQQRAIIKYNESLVRRIKSLEDRLADKNYDTPEKPALDISKDRITIALEARLKKLQGDFYYTKRGVELMNRGMGKKLMSLAATAKRMFVLSRISTFGRLVAADIWSNGIFEPSEAIAASTIGYLGTKIGFARKLSSQADRFGMPATLKDIATIWKGEAAAIKALGNAQTWKDFVSDAKNGYSELSLLYDPHAHSEVPKELRDHWQNIEHGLEAFGRAHGSVKGISKRMEFMRSYYIRKEAARKREADVENPAIQASIGAMAYQDAMRHILMENNLITDKYQEWINDLKKGGFGANAMALTLQEMMPIVKIPTNLVLNAGRSVLGFPLAGGVIAVRGLIELMSKGKSEYGISKLSPEQSDALLRNLRKGQVGMALMLAGYFAPNAFGASHYYQKGSDQPDGLEEGDVYFFGQKVPRWLADNPYLVAMKIGASLKASYDYYNDTQDNPEYVNAARGFFHTLGGAISETPIASTPTQALQGLEGYGGNFWYNQVKSTLEPGLLQEIAEDTDRRDGWFSGDKVKRKPASIGETLKTGIPGLRQQVDEP